MKPSFYSGSWATCGQTSPNIVVNLPVHITRTLVFKAASVDIGINALNVAARPRPQLANHLRNLNLKIIRFSRLSSTQSRRLLPLISFSRLIGVQSCSHGIREAPRVRRHRRRTNGGEETELGEQQQGSGYNQWISCEWHSHTSGMHNLQTSLALC
jgi:hypothetical protein